MPVVFGEIFYSDFEVKNFEPFITDLEAKTRTNHQYMEAKYVTVINAILIYSLRSKM